MEVAIRDVARDRMDVLIGIVGYTPVIESFPLGPRLMRQLEGAFAGCPTIAVENMTWGPIHVVQRFQDPGAVRPKRVILVGASAVCRSPGLVQAFHWAGGRLSDTAMQDRIYEAVTGIVDIENTLMIGGHFDVWPAETFTVEIDMSADTFGAMVMADSEKRSDGSQLAAEIGFSPATAIEQLADCVIELAQHGAGSRCKTSAKLAGTLAHVEKFTKHEFVDLSAARDSGR